jgi:hypothetical protein
VCVCRSGTLTGLHVAFSREQAHKVYVQNKITEEGTLLWELLEKKGAYFYVCGCGRVVLCMCMYMYVYVYVYNLVLSGPPKWEKMCAPPWSMLARALEACPRQTLRRGCGVSPGGTSIRQSSIRRGVARRGAALHMGVDVCVCVGVCSRVCGARCTLSAV